WTAPSNATTTVGTASTSRSRLQTAIAERGPSAGDAIDRWGCRTSLRDSRPEQIPQKLLYLRPYAARRLRSSGPVSTRRRPAEGDRRAIGRPRTRRQVPDAPRCDRLRQDHDDGERHPSARTTDPGLVAQQNPGGAAVRRAQELLPAQRRRV